MKEYNTIKETFPDAVYAADFFSQLWGRVGHEYGATERNTLGMASFCCDEANWDVKKRIAGMAGEVFDLGGLAGYPHGGLDALGAGSHHVPIEDHEFILLAGGPHIGYDHNKGWGHLHRPGMPEVSTSCGSLMGLISNPNIEEYNIPKIIYKTLQEGLDSNTSLATISETIDKKLFNRHLQQRRVGRVLLPHLETGDVNIVSATQYLGNRITHQLNQDIQNLQYTGNIVLATGIIVNTRDQTYWVPQQTNIHSQKNQYIENLF